jgi:hypothetical protein
MASFVGFISRAENASGDLVLTCKYAFGQLNVIRYPEPMEPATRRLWTRFPPSQLRFVPFADGCELFQPTFRFVDLFYPLDPLLCPHLIESRSHKLTELGCKCRVELLLRYYSFAVQTYSL